MAQLDFLPLHVRDSKRIQHVQDEFSFITMEKQHTQRIHAFPCHFFDAREKKRQDITATPSNHKQTEEGIQKKDDKKRQGDDSLSAATDFYVYPSPQRVKNLGRKGRGHHLLLGCRKRRILRTPDAP